MPSAGGNVMVGRVLICGEPIFGRGVAGCQVWVPANIPPILLVTQIIAVSPLFATSKPFPPSLPWFRISTQIINFNFVVNNWKLQNIFNHFFIV